MKPQFVYETKTKSISWTDKQLSVSIDTGHTGYSYAVVQFAITWVYESDYSGDHFGSSIKASYNKSNGYVSVSFSSKEAIYGISSVTVTYVLWN